MKSIMLKPSDKQLSKRQEILARVCPERTPQGVFLRPKLNLSLKYDIIRNTMGEAIKQDGASVAILAHRIPTEDVIAFRRYVRELGWSQGHGEEQIISSDPESLRLVRQEDARTITVEYFHRVGSYFTQAKVATFVQEDESFSAEDLKDFGPLSLRPAWKLTSLSLDSPEGSRLSLPLAKPGEKIPKRSVEIEGLVGKDVEIAFSIRYDLERGIIRRAELRSADGRQKETKYYDSEPHPNVSDRDNAVGESISIATTPGTRLLLRMPRQLDFAQIIKSAFPPEVFKEPSRVTVEQDATWRDIKWLNGALGMTLTRNGQPIPFPL